MDFNSTQINEIISKSNDIVLGTHISPDGDAIGSTFALALALKLMGKNPKVLIENYNPKYNFVKGKEFIYKDNYNNLNPDLFISLDCGSLDRLGDAIPVFEKARSTMSIDHHVSNTAFADYNIICKGISSTCEVVYEIIKNFCALNYDIATAIYTGLVSDTSAFKHNSTSPRTLEIASILLKYDIDFSNIQAKILYSHTVAEVNVFLKAIGRYKFDGKVCYSYLTCDEILNECNAKHTDLDGIVEYLLNFNGIDASVFVYEKIDGTKKVSMRSNGFDVGSIAVKHGGGGHKCAAGANLQGDIQDVVKLIVNEIKNELI